MRNASLHLSEEGTSPSFHFHLHLRHTNILLEVYCGNDLKVLQPFELGTFTFGIMKLYSSEIHLFVYCRHLSCSNSNSVLNSFLKLIANSESAVFRRHLFTEEISSAVGLPEVNMGLQAAHMWTFRVKASSK